MAQAETERQNVKRKRQSKTVALCRSGIAVLVDSTPDVLEKMDVFARLNSRVLGGQAVYNDMHDWAGIRRRVLVDRLSKRHPSNRGVPPFPTPRFPTWTPSKQPYHPRYVMASSRCRIA